MGTLWGSQIIGKQMLRQKSGVIINIASLLAIHGGAGSAAYAASKAGVVGLTRALAAELGSAGVRVNAVLPGYVESDMTKGTLVDITLLLVHSQFLIWSEFIYWILFLLYICARRHAPFQKGYLEEMCLVLEWRDNALSSLRLPAIGTAQSRDSPPECLRGKTPIVLSSDAAIESQKKRYVVDAMADGNPLAMSQKARDDALSKIPSGRFGTVDEVADAALFLATNAYANNCVINLDGGLSAF